jgi:beta-lactamase regulating signal transducer with metallopeptidase domain
VSSMTTMPAIEALLRQPAAQAVGWALLQFVWQGALIGAVTAVTLLTLKRSAADVRYVVASIGLALMLTLAIVTGAQKFVSIRGDQAARAGAVGQSVPPAAEPRSRSIQAPRPRTSELVPQLPRDGLLQRIGWRGAEPLLPALMLGWLVGVTILSLRLLTGWLWIQRLRTRGVSAADDTCRRMAARLARRLHIARAVTLLESTLVDVPTVVGFIKPVVLLPASVLAGLSTQQLEAILAHELAHIRRHDYLVNLLQTLVETVLFYHPAVWWLSRRIRIERENCCDDLAVSLCGDPIAYATALADLESLRPLASGVNRSHGDRIVLAATGGSLLQRVHRLLGAPSSHTGRGPAWLAGSVALLLIGGIALGADGARSEGDRRVKPATASVVTEGTSAKVASVAPSGAAPPAIAARPVGQVSRDRQAVTEPRAAIAAAAAGSEGAVLAARTEPAVIATDAVSAALAAIPGSDAALPVPVVAATSVQSSTSISHRQDGSSGNWIWSDNGEKLQVNYTGAFEFTDDDTDIRELSRGGYLKISDGNWLGRHSVEIRERDGRIERRYYVNGSERPFEPEGRVWLQQNLPRFVRNTGIGAPARVARFLKSGGVTGVMAEIGHIESTYAKGIYFKELFKQATLTPEQYRQAMAQAAREMRSSDYELAQLLISVADRLPADDISRAAYFTAASGIHSDYELRRVYSTMLKRGPVTPQTLAGILEHSAGIDSDYELSELLRQIIVQQPLDDRNRAAFFKTVATIGSDYERHRVLSAVVQRTGDTATVEAALAQAGSIGSDYEAATFLMEVLKQSGVEGAARAPFFRVVSGISSGYERGRVLQAVVRKSDATDDTLRAVLQATKGMSGYELSQLLMAVANARPLTGTLRDVYLDAADRLSGYDQSQVLSALVKSERRSAKK